jgi:hypothetical protein
VNNVAKLLEAATPLLILDSFVEGWTPIEEPPHLTRWESLFLNWCPPALVPTKLLNKREKREAWDSGEAPRFRPPPLPPNRGGTVTWRRPVPFNINPAPTYDGKWCDMNTKESTD